MKIIFILLALCFVSCYNPIFDVKVNRDIALSLCKKHIKDEALEQIGVKMMLLLE